MPRGQEVSLCLVHLTASCNLAEWFLSVQEQWDGDRKGVMYQPHLIECVMVGWDSREEGDCIDVGGDNRSVVYHCWI